MSLVFLNWFFEDVPEYPTWYYAPAGHRRIKHCHVGEKMIKSDQQARSTAYIAAGLYRPAVRLLTFILWQAETPGL
jgi:hypothetical protein